MMNNSTGRQLPPRLLRAVPAGTPLLVVLALALALLPAAACAAPVAEPPPAPAATAGEKPAPDADTEVATFAGGCFWCMEGPFDKLDGVISTTSGYTGGSVEDPSYRQVSSGRTGHTEAVQVLYDPSQISYEKLLEVFWHNVDPTDAGGQFCDRGSQYRTGIFVHDEEQRRLAQASKEQLQSSGQLPAPVVTEILPAEELYPAEEYHQDFYRKNPERYTSYRRGCGRDRRLAELWGSSDH